MSVAPQAHPNLPDDESLPLRERMERAHRRMIYERHLIGTCQYITGWHCPFCGA